MSAVSIVALVMFLGPLGQPSLGEPVDLDGPTPGAVTLTEEPTPTTAVPTETATTPPAPAPATPKASVVTPEPAAPSRVVVPGCDDDDCEEPDDDEWEEPDDDEWEESDDD